jgi:hypothetical protein
MVSRPTFQVHAGVLKVCKVSITVTGEPATALVTDGVTETSLGGQAPVGLGSTVGLGLVVGLAETVVLGVDDALTAVPGAGEPLPDGALPGDGCAAERSALACGFSPLPPPRRWAMTQIATMAAVSTTSRRRQ